MTDEIRECLKVGHGRVTQRREKLYDTHNLEYELSSDRFLYKHSLYAQNLMTKAVIAFLEDTGTSTNFYKWRNIAPSYELIVRYIANVFYERRGVVKMAEFVQILDGKASKSTIRNCLNDGISLGLVRRYKSGYLPTQLWEDQTEERMIERMENKDIIAFFEFAIMWRTQRAHALKAAQSNGDMRFDGTVRSTLTEQMLNLYEAENAQNSQK